MPLFALHCIDKPNSLELRMATRPAHLEYLNGQEHAIKTAGPYLTATGGDPCGSLLIIEAEDEAAARAWGAADPYAKAGLFDRVEVHPWLLARGKIG